MLGFAFIFVIIAITASDMCDCRRHAHTGHTPKPAGVPAGDPPASVQTSVKRV
jgi:hypothetical protein